ncbi:hypothetical protein WUBG_16451, partial [Wuchereria bancrofti]
GELKQQLNSQSKTITHNSTENITLRKTRNSLGAVFISVTGIGLGRQHSQHSVFALERIPSQISVRIPLAVKEQSSSEITDKHETLLLLSSNPLFNETENDSVSISE